MDYLGAAPMPNLLSHYRRFAKDEAGNIAIMFGLTAVVLLTAGGLAVEVSRAMTERSSMANALDAAVLATARSISLGEITRAEAENYMNAMFAANLNVSAEEVAGYRIDNIQFNEATKTLSANGTRDFDTMFRFFGENNALTLRTNSAALYGTTYVEVAMTFDVTGSMKGARLRDLKNAATEGVTLLLGDGESETVRVSSVPYAEAVNAGSLARYVFPDDGGANTAPPRFGDFTTMIESGQRPAGLSPSANLSGSGPLAKDTCATERKGDYAVMPDGPDRAMVNRDDRLSSCPTVALIPLTNDKDRLTSSIATFTAKGVTAGQIGIQWAWYMLAPEWADYLPEGSKPRDPATSSDTVKKYAIIMTDGEFNTAFSGSNRQLPQGPQEREAVRATNQALALCKAMKEDRITVFTIGFGLRDGTRAMNMLRDCATPQDGAIQYFYSATTGADLTAAYTEISRTIQSLRLVR
jgi:Flp pilus assembly protein TadG